MPRTYIKPRRMSGRDCYELARDEGLGREAAARRAGISASFADYVEMLRNREAGNRVLYEPANRDDALVAALVACGGYPRLSERLGRQGHTVCLPLIPYEGRP